MKEIKSEFNKFNEKEMGINLSAETVDNDNQSLVIGFHGSLNTDNSMQISENLLNIIKDGCDFSRIIFDLKELNYISSAGVGTLVTFLQESKGANIELILCNINDKVKTIIETLGFASFFTIVQNLSDIR